MTADPFTTLGLTPRFALQRAELDARHRELSKALHPDRFAGAPASERRRSLSEAINVNHAYRALKDPVQRGKALLSLLDPDGAVEDERADPEFLMEIMQLRESLSEARERRELTRVRSLADGVRERQARVIAQLGGLLDDGPLARMLTSSRSAGAAPTSSTSPAGAAPDPVRVGRARAALGELRYLRRFLEEVDAIEDELG